jgi:hypothetical protein
MQRDALQRRMGWAEERAPMSADPSGAQGAKTHAGGTTPPRPRHPDWRQSDEPPRHEAEVPRTGRPSPLANAHPRLNSISR